MPQKVEILTIFVSGPSNVDSEKAALRPVVDEISERMVRTHGVELRVVGWPDDLRPGVNVDPQAEIKKQFGNEIDIYLGILATRFGTPTLDAGSGTEDEFEQGLARLRGDSRSLRVLFYFKNSKVDPFNLEIDQLQKIKEFRDGLRSRGVLYREFDTTPDFVRMVKNHLDKLVSDEWRDGQWLPIPGLDDDSPRQVTTTVTPSSEDSHAEDEAIVPDAVVDFSDEGDEEDMGLLDYLTSFQEEATAVTQTLERISEITAHIGNELRTRTAEITTLESQYEGVKHVGGSRAQQEFTTHIREVVDLSAKNLNDFVRDMAPQIDEYRRHSRAVFFYYLRFLRARSELGTAQEEDNQQALEILISGLESARASTSLFQDTVNSIPAFTGRLKRAKRKVAAILGELIANMLLTTDEARQTVERVRGMKN